MQIKDSVFLVPGGASGLGAATAQHLVSAGGAVVIADLKAQAGEKFAAGLGARARFVVADVTNEAQVQQAIDTAVKTFGALHGLVNCAGIAPGERVVGKNGPHRLETFSRAININLIGSFNVLRLAAQAMTGNAPNQDGERGVIINTASIAAFEGQIGQVAYSAAKAGIAGMTLTMARDLGSLGIRVVTIAPSLFQTGLTQGIPKDMEDALTKDAAFPKRMGRPEEYAHMAKALFENPMMNGLTLRLDGGQRFAPK
jgi:NAD(P)-dependent dehydrogenase (short-subunit alcohol dehydrogenase family)